MWKKFKENAAAFPLVVIFFAFLFGFTVLDMLWPKYEYSAMENRKLQQAPAVTVSGLISNRWMQQYESYVRDQFALRDSWIGLKSRSEYLLCKTENNGIWYGKDGYLFTKLLAVDEDRLQKNIELLSGFAERHPQKVSFMLVPSAGVVLSDKMPVNAPIADENAYLDDILTQAEKYADVYDLRETFAPYSDEYLYYRTDHHWTTQGAYRAYCAFAESKNKPIFSTQTHTAVDTENFLGTHYSKTRNWNVQPDILTYYEINNTLTLNSEDAADIENNGAVYNLQKLAERDKYAAFLYGNVGYATLTGEGKGRILVIKDSYANCFVPFLTVDYAVIDIVDLRNYNSSIDELIAENGYDDILVLYGFETFASDKYIAGLRR